MGHFRMTEGNWGTLEDLEKDDFHTGFASYRGIYTIYDIEYLKSHPEFYDRIRSVNAPRSNQSFPALSSLSGKYLLTKSYTPYPNIKKGCFDSMNSVIKYLRTLTESTLREDTESSYSIKWDPDSQPNLYNLDTYLRKAGYRLIDVQVNQGVLEPLIEATQDSMTHPEIIYQVTEGYFGVRVKELGVLSREDLDPVVRGYQSALEIIKRLNSLDLSRLEIDIDDTPQEYAEEGESDESGNSEETSGTESN